MSKSLQTVVDILQTIAPLEYAESWDNVGLLVEPGRCKSIKRIMLAIDLTEAVLDEAVKAKVEMIVAYHPPIFMPIKRLTQGDVKQRIIVTAIEKGIAIYSPHTALDAAPGGVNNWLAKGLGKCEISVIEQKDKIDTLQKYKVVVFVPMDFVADVRTALSDAGAGVIGQYTQCAWGADGLGCFYGNELTNPAVGESMQLEVVEEVRLEMACPAQALPAVTEAIGKAHPYEEPAWDIYRLEPKPAAHTGQGRLVTLARPVTLRTMLGRIKKHLKLKHIRVADGGKKMIQTIALCAGAGGSVIGKYNADLYLTGEMGHHDILAATAKGTSVVLTDHTNTERPYLPCLKELMTDLLGEGVQIDLSKVDADPLVFA